MSIREFEEDFLLLVESGFVAVSHMEEDAANKLFQGALVMQHDHFAPKMGLAAIALYKLETKRSTEILEEVMEKHPENHRAMALLGISYLLSGKNGEKGEKLLNTALKESNDPATKKLGGLWLDVIEKVLKKSGPAVPKAPKGKKKNG